MNNQHLRGEEFTPSSRGQSFYINYLECSRLGHLSLHPHLFIYSVFYFDQYGLMFIYFIFWIIIQCYCIFVFQIVSVLATETFSSWFLCSFDMPPSCLFVLGFIFSTSSLFGTVRCFRIILSIFCSSPRISNFSENPWLLSSENDVRSGCRMSVLAGAGV